MKECELCGKSGKGTYIHLEKSMNGKAVHAECIVKGIKIITEHIKKTEEANNG